METKKLSFVEKVIAKLNLNENAKIKLFWDTLVKAWEKQIKLAEKKIEVLKTEEAEELSNLEEQLQELKAELVEVSLSIDSDCIKTNEDRKSYIQVYTENLQDAMDAITAKEKEIKDIKDKTLIEIEKLEKHTANFKKYLEIVD